MCHNIDYSMDQLNDEDFRNRHTQATFAENPLYNLYLDQLDNHKFILLYGVEILGIYDDQDEAENFYNGTVASMKLKSSS